MKHLSKFCKKYSLLKKPIAIVLDMIISAFVIKVSSFVLSMQSTRSAVEENKYIYNKKLLKPLKILIKFLKAMSVAM